MIHKEITDLRKNWELDKAYSLAIEEYNKDKDNFMIKSALSWVLYSFIKIKLEKSNLSWLEKHINMLNDLDLDRWWEIDIYEMSASQFFNSIKNENNIDIYRKKLFYYSKLNNVRPSKTHSFILYNVINRVKKNDNNFNFKFNFYWFIKLWWIYNFLEEDYAQWEYLWKTTQSTFEKVISILWNKIKITTNINDLWDIDDLELILKEWINRELKWAWYYLWKLKLLNWDYKEAESFILKVVKKEKGQFWSWHLLWEVLLKEWYNELYFSALSKALSCWNDDNFLNNLREEYIWELLKKEFYNEANIELNHIINNKNNNKVSINDTLVKLTKNSWYIDWTNWNNTLFYKKYIKDIEEYLYSDIEDKLIYIEYINESKKILNFKEKNKTKWFFNYKNINDFSFKKWDVIKVKIEKIDWEYYNIYKIYNEKYNVLDFFDSISDQLIYIEYINYNKNIINFTNKIRTKWYFNYSGFNIDWLEKWDIINVKIDKQEKELYNIYKLDKEKYNISELFDYKNIIIEYINFNKKILNFVWDYIHGFFNFSWFENIIENKSNWDFLEVILWSRDWEYYNLIDCRDSSNLEDEDLKKNFSWFIDIKNGNKFWFVDDIFVWWDLINWIEDWEEVSWIALLSYNKKKYEYSWKVINLTKIN